MTSAADGMADRPSRVAISLVHGAVAGQRRILRVLHDHQPEALGVAQRAPHHAAAGDRLGAVGEAEGSGLGQQAHLRQLLAADAAGDGTVAFDVDAPGFLGAPGDELDDRHVVDDRAGVGQRY